ncbi:hypothetical protein QUF84_03960 [Fictibacillus enclensis]|uniref:hypothetical protein n=1 Tax=Fictibacillus enclensis TaxID=1017270 RepID=UPI0025A15BAE|nr:hypothetical protein [Fictibacillus enclensis]MDM5336387.1 hypothetical protein [Fictibacillus enclensis]
MKVQTLCDITKSNAKTAIKTKVSFYKGAVLGFESRKLGTALASSFGWGSSVTTGKPLIPIGSVRFGTTITSGFPASATPYFSFIK